MFVSGCNRVMAFARVVSAVQTCAVGQGIDNDLRCLSEKL
ncbi:hypothetical protein Z949_1059 [Sulfitobacter guttiformis KCTC 32187]|nr:hypothetical protein Z949_1059 [Sulfitobacter guttiformis KCTC 32187]